MSTVELKIGTRGSGLALWQANWVASLIHERCDQVTCTVVPIKTTGDMIRDVALSRLGTRGAFTKELDEALIDGRVDICVHSMKDVPTDLPVNTMIAAMLERADARDAFISHDGTLLEDLPSGSRVGTGSLRRRAQLRAARPDLELMELRGNIDTRLKRVEDGTLDAAILASAGITRMGWADRITSHVDPAFMLPAVGQGAVGVQARSNDVRTLNILARINHPKTFTAVSTERWIMRRLEGGCQVPMAAYASIQDHTMHVEALVANLDGSTMIRESLTGNMGDAAHLAKKITNRLVAQGARDILQAVREQASDPTTGQILL